MLPALTKQINLMAEAQSKIKAAAVKSTALVADIKQLLKLYQDIKNGIVGMEKEMAAADKIGDLLKKSKYIATKAVAALNELRQAVDAAETLVAEEFWPMAKYQELLLVL